MDGYIHAAHKRRAELRIRYHFIMQQDIARYLLFTCQQLQADDGLNAQLHGLRLRSAIQAEVLQEPRLNHHVLSDMKNECSRLLLAAGASQHVAAARYDITPVASPCGD